MSKNMKFVAKVGVDAGLIMVGDVSYLDDVPSNPDMLDSLGMMFEVDNGSYFMKWHIRDTWNGDISGEDEITVTSGKIFVCDPCYFVKNDYWDDYLDNTDYCEDLKTNKAFIINEMGGDGDYKVELTLVPNAR